MKILSSFYPQVVPNLYECLCSAEHKGRYSEECGKQSSSGAPLAYLFSFYGSQWCPNIAWLQTFFKISFFVFGRTKKFIQVLHYLRVSKWWQNFPFCVNYPFKEQKRLNSFLKKYVSTTVSQRLVPGCFEYGQSTFVFAVLAAAFSSWCFNVIKEFNKTKAKRERTGKGGSCRLGSFLFLQECWLFACQWKTMKPPVSAANASHTVQLTSGLHYITGREHWVSLRLP